MFVTISILASSGRNTRKRSQAPRFRLRAPAPLTPANRLNIKGVVTGEKVGSLVSA
jgi:hypothetical protein